jgi:hypothetical protein
MSAATNPTPRLSISIRDFSQCENCGEPALIHPRFELNTRVYHERAAILCCACLHETVAPPVKAVTKSRLGFRIGDQIWQCRVCGSARPWGLMQPDDRLARPVLDCHRCEIVTRHRFLFVA